MKLTPKQKKFADAYLETGNGSEAARQAYSVKNDNTAATIAHENMRKPDVQAYFESQADTLARHLFNLAMDSERDTDRIKATINLLDRAGYKPVDKKEVEHSGDFSLTSLFDTATEDEEK